MGNHSLCTDMIVPFQLNRVFLLDVILTTVEVSRPVSYRSLYKGPLLKPHPLLRTDTNVTLSLPSFPCRSLKSLCVSTVLLPS